MSVAQENLDADCSRKPVVLVVTYWNNFINHNLSEFGMFYALCSVRYEHFNTIKANHRESMGRKATGLPPVYNRRW